METNNTTTSNGVHNAHAKDNAAKIVFGDPVLCAQFLKGYTDIPLFKEIKPEDIENCFFTFSTFIFKNPETQIL